MVPQCASEPGTSVYIWDTAPTWVKASLMKNSQLSTSWTAITCAITNGTCIAVIEGLFNLLTFIATACWIIDGEISQAQCKGSTYVHGL